MLLSVNQPAAVPALCEGGRLEAGLPRSLRPKTKDASLARQRSRLEESHPAPPILPDLRGFTAELHRPEGRPWIGLEGPSRLAHGLLHDVLLCYHRLSILLAGCKRERRPAGFMSSQRTTQPPKSSHRGTHSLRGPLREGWPVSLALRRVFSRRRPGCSRITLSVPQG